ncbi:MAG: sialidase family protein [Anaerohalosphaeraceae bacterium]
MCKLFTLLTLIVCTGYAADDPYSGYSLGQRYADKNPPEIIKDNRPAGATEWPLWLQPPEIIKPDQSHYQSAETRKFEGISSLAVSPSGRLWVTWYANSVAPAEDENNYAVLATSGDDGKTWEEILMIDPDGAGPIRGYDSTLWLSPDGRLWLFWGQKLKSKTEPSGVWAMNTNTPDVADPEWTAPVRLTDGVMLNKPTVLSNGTWLLPAAIWRTDNGARVVASTDNGKTFNVLGACNVLPVETRNCDEHMIIERKDGSLWMLVRTLYGIGESVSTDKGRTWSKLTPAKFQQPVSRFFIRRLNSGNLLLIKHGEIDKKIDARSHLMAFISKDDGETWQGGFMIDERNGISYPDGQQAENGVIYITYDYNRWQDKKIFMACFTEQDVLAGKAVTDKVRLRVPVN